MTPHDLFYYDETSPSCLRWAKTTKGRAKKDAPAGTFDKNVNKWFVRFNGVPTKVVNIIWNLLEKQSCEHGHIRHIDGDSSNTKRANLVFLKYEDCKTTTESYLKEGFSGIFYYDNTSKSFLRWKDDFYIGVKRSELKFKKGGEVPVSVDAHGYLRIGALADIGVNLKLHKVVWELFNGKPDSDKVIDHIDQDKTNNNISNLRLVSVAENARNKKKSVDNNSGVTGVCFRSNERETSWRAVWRTTEGKNKEKSFSVRKHGYDEAFRLACEYRAEMIELLNEKGAGYSPIHGT